MKNFKYILIIVAAVMLFDSCSDDSTDYMEEGEKVSLTIKALNYDGTTPKNVTFNVIEKASSPNNREWNQGPGSNIFIIKDAKLEFRYEIKVDTDKFSQTVSYVRKKNNDTWEIWF